jgi:hypothetical protein
LLLSGPSGDGDGGGGEQHTSTIEMSSNPHPAHTDCPALNFGSLQPGQSRTSSPLTSARTCGMHDHISPGNQALQRTIAIR